MLGKLWRGDYGLYVTFWGFGIVGGFAFTALAEIFGQALEAERATPYRWVGGCRSRIVSFRNRLQGRRDGRNLQGRHGLPGAGRGERFGSPRVHRVLDRGCRGPDAAAVHGRGRPMAEMIMIVVIVLMVAAVVLGKGRRC